VFLAQAQKWPDFKTARLRTVSPSFALPVPVIEGSNAPSGVISVAEPWKKML
jgi:hypothetical protein